MERRGRASPTLLFFPPAPHLPFFRSLSYLLTCWVTRKMRARQKEEGQGKPWPYGWHNVLHGKALEGHEEAA